MAGNSSQLLASQTPVKATLRVPLGHIVLCRDWKNTDVATTLQTQGTVNLLYEDSLGAVDFHPAGHIGVVYANEADLVAQNTIRRRLVKLRKTNKVQVLVLAEKTPSSSQYFQSLQKFVTMELGFQVIPVPSQTEAAGILAQIVHTENKTNSNPFRRKKGPVNLDQTLLATVQSIPRLGGVKARQLLEHFHSLHAICEASEQELSQVVGKASAQHIHKFLSGIS